MSTLLEVAIAACLAVWLRFQRARAWEIIVTALILVLASILRRRLKGIARGAGTLLLFSVCVYWYRQFRTVPEGQVGGAGLSLTVFVTFLSVVILSLDWAPELLTRATALVARKSTLYWIGVLLVLLPTADVFFLNRGERFDARLARTHPVFATANPRSYLYSNANERYVKDARSRPFLQKKPAQVVRIILTGASTMYGIELADADSPVFILEQELERLYPDRPYELILTAYPGRYQLHELIEATAISPHWQPDLVISFNGFNEVWFAEPEGFYEGRPYVADQVDATLETSPLLALFYRESYLGSFLWKRRLDRPRQPQELVDPQRYEPPRYFSYLRKTARYLAEAHIGYVYAFCPNAVEMPNHLKEHPQCYDLRERAAKRRRLAEELVVAEGQQSYDAMEPLRGENERAIFRDDCHFTPAGVRIMMKDVARRIPGWLERAAALRGGHR